MCQHIGTSRMDEGGRGSGTSRISTTTDQKLEGLSDLLLDLQK